MSEVAVVASKTVANEVRAASSDKIGRLGGFRRFTSTGNYIPEIDGLRFIAIAAVVTNHLGTVVALAHDSRHFWSDRGTWGVQLFFVISGFMLSMPFAMHHLQNGRPVELKRYFLRRLTRLEPPYLLSCLLMTVLKCIAFTFIPPRFFVSVLVSLFYAHDLVFGWNSPVSAVIWSLEVEIQFYLLMPLLAFVFLIPQTWMRRGILLAGMVGVICIQPIPLPAIDFPNVTHLLNQLQFFLAGLLLADVYAVEWKGRMPGPTMARVAWGDWVWLVGWPMFFWMSGRDTVGWRIALVGCIFMLYFSLFYSVWMRRLMCRPAVCLVGGMCYSIYLLHNLIILSIGRMMLPWLPASNGLAMLCCAAVLLPPVLLVSGLFYRLVERPCMRPDWPARLGRWFASRLFVETK